MNMTEIAVPMALTTSKSSAKIWTTVSRFFASKHGELLIAPAKKTIINLEKNRRHNDQASDIYRKIKVSFYVQVTDCGKRPFL